MNCSTNYSFHKEIAVSKFKKYKLPLGFSCILILIYLRSCFHSQLFLIFLHISYKKYIVGLWFLSSIVKPWTSPWVLTNVHLLLFYIFQNIYSCLSSLWYCFYYLLLFAILLFAVSELIPHSKEDKFIKFIY